MESGQERGGRGTGGGVGERMGGGRVGEREGGRKRRKKENLEARRDLPTPNVGITSRLTYA